MANFVILGGTSDIGAAVCERLAASGHRFYLAARDGNHVAERAERYGMPSGPLDAADSGTFAAAFEAATAAFETIDGAVNLIGSVLFKPAHLTTDAEWQETLMLNLSTAFYTVREAAKAMPQGGSLVLLSSSAGRVGVGNHEAIAAAKAGVLGLTRAAAATYAGRGMRVNAVAPGLVKTKLTQRVWEHESQAAASRAMHPLNRLGEPDDIANAICWLLDPGNAWVTGQTIGVDGGLSRVTIKPKTRG